MKTFKTLSKGTAEKNLAKLVADKKLNKTSVVYRWISEMLNGETFFRPVYSQGSTWNGSCLFDRQDDFTNVLNMLRISYETGNDAPRGGKTGAFVKIATKIK